LKKHLKTKRNTQERKNMEQIYLSRRNLQSLLNKLDRNKNAGYNQSACTIIKNDTEHPQYPQSIPNIAVIAIEDDLYYTDREAGEVHPADNPRFAGVRILRGN
jgi:hypothetical protein